MIKKANQLSAKEYKALFNTYYTPLCLFSNKYMNNLDLSKDVVQDVFINVWKKKVVLRSEAEIKSFLYTAVKNKSLDYLKSKYQKTKSPHTLDDIKKMEKENFFYKEVVVTEASEILEKAINTLPVKCKKIIQLSLNGLSNKQIAEELSISLNTIKTQKRIAYTRLRPLLKDYFFLFIPYFF